MIFEPAFLRFLLDLAKFVVVLSVLIIVHEWGHFIAAKKSGVRVDIFSIGFGRKLYGRKHKGTEFTVSAIPMGGYVKLAGDSPEEFTGKPDEYLSQPASKRVKIIVFGPLMNYLLGFVLFACVFMIGYPALGTRVGEVMPGMGAEAAGIRQDDLIVSVDGTGVRTWDNLVAAVRKVKGRDAVSVSVLRGAEPLEFSVPLSQGEARDELMQKKRVGQIGIRPSIKETLIIKYGPLRSLQAGAEKTVELTVMTYKALGFMIFGRLSMRESMTGPLGMYDIFSKAQSIVEILLLTAVVSVSLALFNLLPLPILDGGHIFFLALEKIRRKPISKKTEELVVKIGLALLISVAILVSINDIIRLGYVQKVRDRLGHAPANNTTMGTDGQK